MKKFTIIAIMIVAVLVTTACGGNGNTNSVKKVYEPEWYRLQDNVEFVQVYGKSVKVSENSSYDAAYANAMLEAALYVETYVKGMIKNYEEEAGVNNPQLLALVSKVVKAVASAKFNNTLVTKQETIVTAENRFKTFVRVSIPKEAVNKNLVNKIKNEEALYNQFKASQAFGELEEEVKKY